MAQCTVEAPQISIGLHPRDNDRLIETLGRLRDLGNTVVVVEHDEDTMRASDHIIDFGPGPGVRGGYVVAEGDVEQLVRNTDSVTGQYLSGKREIAVPNSRRLIRRRHSWRGKMPLRSWTPAHGRAGATAQ